MKNIFKKGLALLSLFALSTSVSLDANANCQESLRKMVMRSLGRSTDQLSHELRRFDFVRVETIEEAKKADVLALAKKFGVNKLESNRLIDIISDVYLVIRSKGVDLKNAEKMAQFGEQIREFYKGRSAQSVDGLDMMLALSVARLEAFKQSEYKVTNDHYLAKPTAEGKAIGFAEYKQWVSSYIQDIAPYKTLKASHGVLSEFDYRNIVQHNRWPVFMKDHDIRHVHYGVGHPKAMAALFEVARSKNAKRYFLITSLFEGVDRVQYTHERALTQYFDGKGYTLQQAMLLIARAPEALLDRIASEANITSRMESSLQTMKDYKPMLGGEFNSLGAGERKYQSEVDQMIKDFHDYTPRDTDVNMRGVLEYRPDAKVERQAEAGESDRIIY